MNLEEMTKEIVRLNLQIANMRNLFQQVEIALTNMRVDQHAVALRAVREVTLSKGDYRG